MDWDILGKLSKELVMLVFSLVPFRVKIPFSLYAKSLFFYLSVCMF